MDRLRSRTQLALVGGYEGGRRDRRPLRNWRPKQTSANEDISPDLPDLRSRSRDLIRNMPLATGAIATVVTNVIGDGLVLKSEIDRDALGLDDAGAEAWQAAAEREFAIWAKRPDFTGRQNWDGLQALAFRAVLESGDVFIVRRRRTGPNDTYGLKLQVIEADRISNPNRSANTVNLVDGVEMDSDGVPVAYNISSAHPDDSTRGVKRTWKRYALGSTITGSPLILHLYDQKRPEQARGVPYLAPVIGAIKQLGDYHDAEVRAAVISAMFTVFVKPQVLEGDGDASFLGHNDSTTGVDADKELEMGAGAIVDLAAGEDVVFADPKRPNTAFDSFTVAFTRHIAVALDMPFEVLVKHFTASYSASRAALEMAWQFFRMRRSWLAWNYCQQVYEWVITEAVASGRLPAPGFFVDPLVREAWLGSDWIGPSRIQLDPQKEATADETDLRMGTKTRNQIITERTGGTWEGKHRQLVKEETARKADGLNMPPPGQNGNAPIDDDDDPPRRDDDEDDEQNDEDN
jgi:lambda family phage portal protein